MKRIIFLIIGGLILIAIGIGFYQFNKPKRTAAKEDAQFVLSSGDLVKAFTTDESGSNAKYLNKVIKVSGIVSNISESNTEITVYLKDPDQSSGVMCSFEKGSFDKSKIKQGSKQFVKGICSGYLMDVVLNQCALDVEAEK